MKMMAPVSYLGNLDKEELAAHWIEIAYELDMLRPIYMSEPNRLYAEMVLAIGKFRFKDFVAEISRQGYRHPDEPTDKERQDAHDKS